MTLPSAPDPAVLARVRIVLVETSHPGNVGSVARAMKVMGLSRLALVSPRFPDVLASDEARALASGAVDVLERATVHASLGDALVGVREATALSAREREYAPPLRPLREAAAQAIALASEASDVEVAFVFGSERFGLSNEDVLRCQACCRIDTSPDYGSLNLAQAVQLVAYECRMATATDTTDGSDALPATHDEQEALIAHFEQGLVAIGFLDPGTPKKLMPRLRRLFARARLEHDEVQWLRGIAKAMTKAGR